MARTELGSALVVTARRALARAFHREGPEPVEHDALGAPGATFVTLIQRGELRGCVGTLEAHRSLREDVEQNALAAAFHDPRFEPLAAIELDDTRIEISLLSPSLPLMVATEEELLAKLRPGIDGVVLSRGARRATFLPQVWTTLPEPRAFIAALKDKAGISPRGWDAEIRVACYTVEKFVEAEEAQAAAASS